MLSSIEDRRQTDRVKVGVVDWGWVLGIAFRGWDWVMGIGVGIRVGIRARLFDLDF